MKRIAQIELYLFSGSTFRILSHLLFWIIVAFFYFFLFSRNADYREVSVIFSSCLLPVALFTTYFFNYYLLPRYLWTRRYMKFFLFSFYTILTGIWLSFLIVFFTLVYILNQKSTIPTSVLLPELQVITLYFIVFLGIAVKQIKRAFLMQQEKNEVEKMRLTTELKLKEAELKLLKAQIHPHFLFNTLNNLYGLTLEKSSDAPGMVLRLSEILDYILYRCEQKWVPLKEEISNLQNYIGIEKIRYSEKLDIKVDLPDNLENQIIAPLLLLPFVENAFKHGVSRSTEHAWIALDLKVSEGKLLFRIENSKCEPTEKNKNGSRGIGLVNAKKRLELVYPERYILTIKDDPKTFSVNLTLELKV